MMIIPQQMICDIFRSIAWTEQEYILEHFGNGHRTCCDILKFVIMTFKTIISGVSKMNIFIMQECDPFLPARVPVVEKILLEGMIGCIKKFLLHSFILRLTFCMNYSPYQLPGFIMVILGHIQISELLIEAFNHVKLK